MNSDDFLLISLIILGISFLYWVIENARIDSEKSRILGFLTKKPTLDDTLEANKMMLEFLHHSMDGDSRQWHECDKGCEGAMFVMEKNTTLAEMIGDIHFVGGQIVLRKVANYDIEKPGNTKAVVCGVRADADVELAKSIEKKYSK